MLTNKVIYLLTIIAFSFDLIPHVRAVKEVREKSKKPKENLKKGELWNPNWAFKAVEDDDGNIVAIEQIAPIADEIKNRSHQFDSPPDWMINELSHDLIQSDQPRIGILTQPTRASNLAFDADQYILEINYDFVRWAGSVPVVIPYDIDEHDLAQLLPQINGVLFTGGGLDLIDKDKKPHPYYQTAKSIFNHVVHSKDVLKEDFPVLGIC